MTAKPYTAEELAELRARAGNVWHTLEGMPARLLATIAAVEQERDELREAAGALLANLDDGNSVYWCGERAMGNAYCSRAQTKTHHGRSYCDEHAPAGAVDTPGAPALRRLRALLEVKP